MTGPGFSVNTGRVHSVATDLDDIGDDLKNKAKDMQALEMTATHRSGLGPPALFGVQVPDSLKLGQQYNDLINMLAAYGDKLGETLKNTAKQLNTAGDNYTRTDQSIAGN
jgi:hypothetical protein